MTDFERRRFLGIDYGTRRIGLSVSDPTGNIASPLTTILVSGSMDDAARAVMAAARDYEIDEWVVGLPLNMDGSTGPQSQLTQAFARCLELATGGPVHMWDERQSSIEANQRMARSGLTHKKKKRRRDAVAAQVILQSYLDAHP